MGVISFAVGAVLINSAHGYFPRRVVLEPPDAGVAVRRRAGGVPAGKQPRRAHRAQDRSGFGAGGVTMSEPPVVEVREISKHFGEGPTRVDALRDVSLDVYPGTVVGLRGPSGSGKSTLLNVIGCILEPNSGSMRLNGELVYDGNWLRADLRRLRLEKIGFIFQSHNLLPFLNAWENVAVAPLLAGATPAQAKERAHRAADLSRRRAPQGCDAGATVRRRGAARRDCARARPTIPRIILADEPTAALNSQRAGAVMDLLAKGRGRAADRRDRGDPRREDLQPLRPHLLAARRRARSAQRPGGVAVRIMHRAAADRAVGGS